MGIIGAGQIGVGAGSAFPAIGPVTDHLVGFTVPPGTQVLVGMGPGILGRFI